MVVKIKIDAPRVLEKIRMFNDEIAAKKLETGNIDDKPYAEMFSEFVKLNLTDLMFAANYALIEEMPRQPYYFLAKWIKEHGQDLMYNRTSLKVDEEVGDIVGVLFNPVRNFPNLEVCQLIHSSFSFYFFSTLL